MLSRRLLRIKVIKTLYAHFKSEASDVAVSERNLVAGIDKAYDLYVQLLMLLPDVCDYARERIELARAKRLPTWEDLHPNLKLVENQAIARLALSEAIRDYARPRGLGWSRYPELIRTLYTNLTDSEYYTAYMASDVHLFREDVQLAVAFYSREVEDLPLVESVLEEQSILWDDDLGFALQMVVRTLTADRKSRPQLALLPEFKSEEDRAFARELFRRTAFGFAESLRRIERFTQNWDVERIAFMDNLIMATAIAELISCPSIPVKVTLDEYIEISKYYSTPGSSTFINGVLDRVVESLREEGLIEKSGRGLL